MKIFNQNKIFGAQRVVDEFAKNHKAGYCRMPFADVELMEFNRPFTASATKAVPLSVMCLGAATKTEDQGRTPKCAAYSASSLAENILWRKTGVLPTDIDPDALYAYAKSVDGDPNGDGTSLTAVGQALLAKGIFDKTKCAVRTIFSPFDVRAAVHRYGCCLLGLNITDEWYRGNTEITSVTAPQVGGHAVMCPGYDQDGPWVQNSWGLNWGQNGFAHISWRAFNRQFMYGMFISGCYKDMD